MRDINYILPRVLLGYEAKGDVLLLHLGKKKEGVQGVAIADDRYQKLLVPLSMFGISECEGEEYQEFLKDQLVSSLNDTILMAVGGKRGKIVGLFFLDYEDRYIYCPCGENSGCSEEEDSE